MQGAKKKFSYISLNHQNHKVKIFFFYQQTYIHKEDRMKQSIYKTYDDLPLFLNATMVAQVLGISAASSYELMHEKDFPVLKVGNRMIVPKEKFITWVEQNTNGGST